jgi:hypothetical protein
METGMSDKNGCRSPDMHLLKFTASNKENIIQRWNLQNCKKTEKPVKHDPDKHF